MCKINEIHANNCKYPLLEIYFVLFGSNKINHKYVLNMKDLKETDNSIQYAHTIKCSTLKCALSFLFNHVNNL